MSNYISAFKEKLQAKSSELFSLLLCDISQDSPQRWLLDRILFENEKLPIYWYSYITCTVKAFPEKKLQLQRLVNKALEVISENEFRNDESYLQLHLISASMKRFGYYVVSFS
jgi:hypothetical protein